MKTKIALMLAAILVSCSPSESAVPPGTKPYTMKTCLVSGNELGAMGKPISKVYNGQEIKFCCKPCIKKFEANQAKYLEKLK